eukprot:261762-Prymnesium_polylepis.1
MATRRLRTRTDELERLNHEYSRANPSLYAYSLRQPTADHATSRRRASGHDAAAEPAAALDQHVAGLVDLAAL